MTLKAGWQGSKGTGEKAGWTRQLEGGVSMEKTAG